MANSGRTTLDYKPRLTDEEAYEKLPPTLRKLLQESVNDWSSYGALRFFNKHGLKETIKWIQQGDEAFMKKGWIVARGKRKAMLSSYVVCCVKPTKIYNVKA